MADPTSTLPHQQVAAVDLGSNSFHMVVARVVDGELQVLDRIKHRVQLAAGLGPDGQLSPKAQKRALACLEQFGQRLAHVPQGNVRAVGTNTLRKARNRVPFLVLGARALGHPIEVVSGREEARLIYLGVAHDRHDPGQRLVVDIGGGSTELIIGQDLEPIALDSLYMGCVSWSQRFFPRGAITKDAFKAAMTAANLELEPIVRTYRELGWQTAVGSSGTIAAIHQILSMSEELGGAGLGGIDRKGLKRLRKRLVEVGHTSRLHLPGLKADRRPVLAGGVAILSSVVESLGIDAISPSSGAMREGILVDLMGRMRRADVREESIEKLARRCGVGEAQVTRVTRTVGRLLEQSGSWLADPSAWPDRLCWAAHLHEVGKFVSFSSYHKHGAYLIANADIPGFSREEQQVLAALVLSHRGRLADERVRPLVGAASSELLRAATLLRLAVRIHRSRAGASPPDMTLLATGSRLELTFPDGWLDRHPLTRADLEAEASALSAAGFTLTVA